MRRLTAQVEFAGAVGCERTPVSLVRRGSAVTDALWLPWFVEGLEKKDVDAPLQHTAHGLLVEGMRVASTCLCRSIVGTSYASVSLLLLLKLSRVPSHTITGPSGLAIGQLDVAASDALDMANGLLDIIEVCSGGILDVLSLPVGERVDEAEILY